MQDCARAFRSWGTEIDFSSMQVEKVIGTGAFAVVYRAKWRGKNVAIKKLLSTAGAPINAKTIYVSRRQFFALLPARAARLIRFCCCLLCSPGFQVRGGVHEELAPPEHRRDAWHLHKPAGDDHGVLRARSVVQHLG
jgi:hypothetical protein